MYEVLLQTKGVAGHDVTSNCKKVGGVLNLFDIAHPACAEEGRGFGALERAAPLSGFRVSAISGPTVLFVQIPPG